MHPSVGMLALAGFLIGPSPSSGPSWVKSYSAAQMLGAQSQKPLALVIGKGENGQDRLVRDGQWNEEIKGAFAAHYVCVYLDAALPENQKLIKELEIRSEVGLVLSNRKGDYQVFHHDGALAKADLVRHLKRHGQAEEPVVYGETVTPSSPTQSSQAIQRVEYRPGNSRPVPSSTYRTSRSSQNC